MTKLAVTQHEINRARDDIARGVRREECCPVARVLRNAGYHGALVLDGGIEYEGITREMPSAVKEFVDTFDGTSLIAGLAQPFEFEFDEDVLAF